MIILYFNEDSCGAIFSCNEIGILSIDLNNINLDDTIMMKMILKPLFMSDFWLGILNLKNVKHIKKKS